MVVNYQRIYEHAGYLFYAIAAADGAVKDAELAVIKDLINKEWLPLEDSTDEFGTDAAHYIFMSFDILMDRGTSADEAFEVFKDYFDAHKNAFTEPVRQKILMTATAVARAFAGQNKAESKYLKELKRMVGGGSKQ
jgi:hypothetical protein